MVAAAAAACWLFSGLISEGRIYVSRHFAENGSPPAAEW